MGKTLFFRNTERKGEVFSFAEVGLPKSDKLESVRRGPIR